MNSDRAFYTLTYFAIFNSDLILILGFILLLYGVYFCCYRNIVAYYNIVGILIMAHIGFSLSSGILCYIPYYSTDLIASIYYTIFINENIKNIISRDYVNIFMHIIWIIYL